MVVTAGAAGAEQCVAGLPVLLQQLVMLHLPQTTLYRLATENIKHEGLCI